MAAPLIAEAVLSASFTVLIEKLAAREFLNFFRHRKLDDRLLRQLRLKLVSVDRLLVDAEEKQIIDPKVKSWLDELKHAAYQAQDFLDELQAEIEAAPKTSASQLLDIIVSLDPRQNKGEEMETKLKELLQIFEDILEEKDALGLAPGNQERTLTILNRQTTSLVDDSSVFGRDGDKEAIVKLLLSDDASNACPGVVSIVGMGGIGKTTLAQLAFKDSRVRARFDKLKAWVCVSEEFEVLKLTKNILKEIGSSYCDSMTPNQLQLELQEKVKGKRILIVLDDVWNNINWEFLLTPLKSAAQGSKILVTTRDEWVVPVVSTGPSYHLKELSEDDCWSLFEKHAMDGHKSEGEADLRELGRKLVRKCKGLPLAAKSIGSLLHSERRVGKWEQILKSNMWDLNDGKIIPALRLSYHYLPPHLKQCFVYCAMFPKGFEFKREDLILLWMAEGFIGQHNNKRREMEDIGEKYFEDLFSRSFFQKHGRHVGNFVMHDLINDLAKSIAGEFCYNNVDYDSASQPTERTRHLFYKGGNKSNALEELDSLSKAGLSRTFIYSIRKVETGHVVNFLPRLRHLRVLHLYGEGVSLEEDGANISHLVSSTKQLRCMRLQGVPILNLPETMPYLQTLIIIRCPNLTSLPYSIGDMKDLRYLSLKMTGIKSLPDSIGNLKDLRHLDLGFTFIERLPGSICGLYKLQHLSLQSCSQLVELPAKMMDLANLCRLDITGTKLESMPPQMGKLVKLQSLSDFIVGKDRGSSIRQLGKLRHLQGELCLGNLQNVTDVRDALEAKMKDKSRMKGLAYMWKNKDNIADTGNSSLDISLLQHLQPSMNIKCITIKGHRGTNFPNWVGDSSFSNIVSLTLLNCKYCTCLPPLGQLASLQHLFIHGFDSIVSVGAEFYGSFNSIQPFRSLTELRFSSMPQWQQWSCCENKTQAGFTVFPQLQYLTISYCSELVMALKEGIFSPSTLQRLEIEGCNKIISGRVDWDLHKLPSLSEVVFGYAEDIQSFPGKMLLPSTITSITIRDLQNLKSLDSAGLQHMTSLQTFIMENCPNLGCIPDEELPKSLNYLSIYKCPLLEKRCRKEHGEDWPKISGIRSTYIGGCRI